MNVRKVNMGENVPNGVVPTPVGSELDQVKGLIGDATKEVNMLLYQSINEINADIFLKKLLICFISKK